MNMNRIESGILTTLLLGFVYTLGAFLFGYSTGQREARKECASHYQDTLRDVKRLSKEVNILVNLVDRHYIQPANTNRLIVRNASFRDRHVITSDIFTNINTRVGANIFFHQTNRTSSIKEREQSR